FGCGLDRGRGSGRGVVAAQGVTYRRPARVFDLGKTRERWIADHRVLDHLAGDGEAAVVELALRFDRLQCGAVRADVAAGRVDALRVGSYEAREQRDRALDVTARARDRPRVASGVRDTAGRSGGVEVGLQVLGPRRGADRAEG